MLCILTALCLTLRWGGVRSGPALSVITPGSVSEDMSSMKAGAPGGAGARLLCPWDFLGKNHLPGIVSEDLLLTRHCVLFHFLFIKGKRKPTK